MDEYLINSEQQVRLAAFVFLLLILLFLQKIFPRRTLQYSFKKRFTTNLSLSLINTLLMRVFLPIAASTVAIKANQENFGLLNKLSLNDLLACLLAILILDFVIYWQHRLFHQIPCLWRLHRMHHSDLDIDTTTAVRFHPIEIFISMLIKLSTVWILGAPVIAVIFFEIILSACALFNHSNINIPVKIDKILRFMIVTPDMHRVHHSSEVTETNSNYGFNFPWWDKIFKSYKQDTKKGHLAMEIGLKEFRNEQSLNIFNLLKQPFINANQK